jgi:hypothetical protein
VRRRWTRSCSRRYFREFIFSHKRSKTLIVTDTIIILEAGKLDQP